MKVLEAVVILCRHKNLPQTAVPNQWLSTRDVAEYCDFSIYRARYLLSALTADGLVETGPGSIHNSLRWRMPMHLDELLGEISTTTLMAGSLLSVWPLSCKTAGNFFSLPSKTEIP